MKIFKHIQNYTRTLSICLVFGALTAFTATLQAESNTKQYQEQNLSKAQLECLSKAAYFEAKSESDAGMLAVIHTTLNRVKDVRFPKTVCGVVYQPSQYSWTKHNPKIKEKEQYERAKRLAQEVVDGKHKDVSRGALYFNSLHQRPRGTICTTRIGGHSFYKPVK